MIQRLLSWLLVAAALSGQLPPVPEQTPRDREDALRPRIFVAQRSVDLGAVVEGEKRDAAWRIENRGPADLVIEKTKSSCGCTVVELAEGEHVIRPGEVLELKATFDSAQRSGRQIKHVTVYTNDPVEPEVQLELKAHVAELYVFRPPGIINLRALRKGETASRTVEIIRGKGRGSLEIVAVEPYEGQPIHYEIKRLGDARADRYQLQFTVPKDASLGTLSSQLKIKLRVDGYEREKILVLRGEVVGPLTWQPKKIDVTRQKVTRGKRLIPLTIRSTDKVPFDVLGVSAGPLLDATCEPVTGGAARTQYKCYLQVRRDAPPGPFAATLEVQCSVLDQPLIQVPVFGVISPPVEVDPPGVLLRQDGTEQGRRRTIKLESTAGKELKINSIRCDLASIVATVGVDVNSRGPHIRYLDVALKGRLKRGIHRTVLVVETAIEGAGSVEIPVTIQVP